MTETLLSIQEAAALSGKSIQTIRRAVKSKRLSVKKKKTPQGFNYLISKESLLKHYKIQASLFEREAGGLNTGKEKTYSVAKEFATLEDLKKLQKDIEAVLEDHKKEKESFVRFMKAFQEKFVVLENQLKLLESPKKKWYHFLFRK
jgi:hypothetical protein